VRKEPLHCTRRSCQTSPFSTIMPQGWLVSEPFVSRTSGRWLRNSDTTVPDFGRPAMNNAWRVQWHQSADAMASLQCVIRSWSHQFRVETITMSAETCKKFGSETKCSKLNPIKYSD
jgi:hypothetical protein